jgi:anthraniloyl-CoA monooxygenase
MRAVSIGGGPAGLFFAILLKRLDPSHQVTVYERNRLDDTFGFGVVFSDATLDGLQLAEPETLRRVRAAFHHWDDIDIFRGAEHVRSRGHGFAGVSRRGMLQILTARALELGVDVRHHAELVDPESVRDADLVLVADGVSSGVRNRYAQHFGPQIDWRPNRFAWLGTTMPLDAFTFYFDEDAHGLWRVHAYQYEPGQSTFIVEATGDTWTRTGLPEADDAATVAFCERLFAHRLQGHKLVANRSLWRRFPNIRNTRWCWENFVLVGDAAHTAHFSIGSGTKLAMEDAIELVAALGAHRDVREALAAYEAARRPGVESLQRAAQTSLEWFEEVERYRDDPMPRFAASLLTRSMRITHEDLGRRDPALVADLDAFVAREAAAQSGVPVDAATPPMFTPFKLRSVVLPNRVVVSPMCQYRAVDGVPGAWHLVHLGARAQGGAGLVMTEMTDVSPEGRITPGCTGLYNDAQRDAWRDIVAFVHDNTAARIGVQLGHAGRKGSTCIPFAAGYDVPLAADAGAWQTVAPSAVPWADGHPAPRAMTRDEMLGVTRDFVDATVRARDAGFDLVELHCAHGYLLASFLSPLTNHRTDDYGGTLVNRLRFPLEVFSAMRAVWPEHLPMSVRISAEDWVDGGMTPADAVEIARAFREAGCDLVDVSAGQTSPDERPRYGRLFQTPFSDRVRHEAGIATMAVGAITSYSDVNTIIAAGRADLCALARAHLYDPYYTLHAAREQGVALRWPDPYRAVERFTPRVK